MTLSQTDRARLVAARAINAEHAALELLRQAAGWDTGPDWDDPDHIAEAYRAAAKRHHPDLGGDPVTFRAVTAARDLLLG